MNYYQPSFSSVANPSLSAGLFTDPSQLRVSASNFGSPYSYAVASPVGNQSGAPNADPGWSRDGQTWSNWGDFTDTPALDAARQAAILQAISGGNKPAALTASEPENAILATVPGAQSIALAARRMTDAQQPDLLNRYSAFAANPLLTNYLDPVRQALYKATYGMTPDEEIKFQNAQIDAREKQRGYQLKPQEEAFKNFGDAKAELGFNPEEFLSAYESLSDKDRTPADGTFAKVQLPSHFQSDPLTGKPMEIPGEQIVATPRNIRLAYGARNAIDPFLKKADIYNQPAVPTPEQSAMVSQQQRREQWQQLEAKAAAEAADRAARINIPDSRTSNGSAYGAWLQSHMAQQGQ